MHFRSIPNIPMCLRKVGKLGKCIVVGNLLMVASPSLLSWYLFVLDFDYGFSNFDYVKTTGICNEISSLQKGDRPEKEGEKYFKTYGDRYCRKRCDKDPLCTGFTSQRSWQPFDWCETYTSEGLTGDGSKYFDCWMKGTISIQ